MRTLRIFPIVRGGTGDAGLAVVSGRESLRLAPGESNGINASPVVGRPITIGEATREERTDADTPFTTLYVAGMATSRIRLIGNFARFARRIKR